ncbi:3-deoxy-manno-octulosonate cytidylyltransferase [Acidihalobacter prosperus]
MRFRVVIPARYASSRFPGKLLASLAGRPLLAYVYESALASGAEEVIIATDDERIADACEEFGASVMMTSDLHRSGSERLAEVAYQRGWDDETIVVNLQGDEPLTPPDIIYQVAEDLSHFTQASVSTLCAPIESIEQMVDPHTVKLVRDADGYAMYFSRAPIPWERDAASRTEITLCDCWRHIGIYAYRAGYLREYSALSDCNLEHIEKLEQLRVLWHGARIHTAVAVTEPGHGVDTPQDLERVEALLTNHRR